jgi:hypothetical protein
MLTQLLDAIDHLEEFSFDANDKQIPITERPDVSPNRGKVINRVVFRRAYELVDKKGQPIKSKWPGFKGIDIFERVYLYRREPEDFPDPQANRTTANPDNTVFGDEPAIKGNPLPCKFDIKLTRVFYVEYPGGYRRAIAANDYEYSNSGKRINFSIPLA